MKHFVLDTNILLHDPRAITQFADNEVVIPIFVIEEIDNFKKEASELGRNAREVARLLDGLRAEGARLSDGAPLPNGGRLRVASAARRAASRTRRLGSLLASASICGSVSGSFSSARAFSALTMAASA